LFEGFLNKNTIPNNGTTIPTNISKISSLNRCKNKIEIEVTNPKKKKGSRKKSEKKGVRPTHLTKSLFFPIPLKQTHYLTLNRNHQ